MLMLALFSFSQSSPEKHAEAELGKIEAMGDRFAPPRRPGPADVDACKKIMRGLVEWCGEDAARIRAVSRALGKRLAREGPARPHEYYYLWLGHPFLRREPPEDVTWLDGLAARIDAYRKTASPQPTGREQTDVEMVLMCGELLAKQVGGPALKGPDYVIDWASWDEAKADYARKRPTLRYDPVAKKYVW